MSLLSILTPSELLEQARPKTELEKALYAALEKAVDKLAEQELYIRARLNR
jgi:hypothetical protein